MPDPAPPEFDPLEELRREIQIGRDQLDRGEYTEHDEQSLRKLFDEIQSLGMRRYQAARRGH